jgi:hypothetical protein
VVDKQFWIVKQDNQKVGNIQASADGYQVTLNNQVASYKTLPALRRTANIEFEPAETASKPVNDQVHGYDTGCRAYNGMWNVQMRVPLFTKQSKSKSWFAAGWYMVKQHRAWRAVKNPKLIVLQRYAYQGPFHSKEQANESV